MKKLPNQLYSGLFEIVKDHTMYYYSRVGPEYCHLTDEGKEAVLQWIEIMAPQMYKKEQAELDLRAKQMVWNELKK